MRNTSPILVNEIRRLSQEEGLRDSEIGDIIGYHRISIQRIREKYNIPIYNIEMRKDCEKKCPMCKKIYYIRRKDKKEPNICCPECAEKYEEMIANRFVKNKGE